MIQQNFIRVEELRAMLAEINAAAGQSELSALYVRHIGYCPFEDDPTETVDSVRDVLRDFIREVCASEGIHASEVFGEE